MKLTDNFHLSEFIYSETAEEHGLKNEPNAEQKENISRLCSRVLQPLREAIGDPLSISSGFRSDAVNELVGGTPTSQHKKGEAADVAYIEPRKLLSKLLELRLDFDQAILYPTFLHISYRSGFNRHQVLYAEGVQP